jgi:hypothetical protein
VRHSLRPDARNSRAAQAVAILPAVEFTTLTPGTVVSDVTLGHTFTLSSSVVVNGLGYFNEGDSFDHQVGIWDASNVLVASATVSHTAAAIGHFRWASLNLTTLAAGTYTIGGEVFAHEIIPRFLGGITTIPQYAYGESVFHPGSGLVQPTTADGNGSGDNAFLVANFSIAPSLTPSPVPEPAAWTLMIAGFGLAGAGLRRRRERKAQFAG